MIIKIDGKVVFAGKGYCDMCRAEIDGTRDFFDYPQQNDGDPILLVHEECFDLSTMNNDVLIFDHLRGTILRERL